jgi:hypothetical protein
MAAKWLNKLLNGLKQVAPTIVGGVVGTVAGPLGPVVGGVVANLMRKVTGQPAQDEDYESMAQTIMGSPELQLRVRGLAIEQERIELERLKAEIELETTKVRADTARIDSVNATMQAEAGSDKWWTSGWRPYFGFVTGTVWGILGLAMATAIILVACGAAEASVLAIIGTAFAGMAVFWSVPLAVCGVSAWKRGDEKIERIKARETKSRVPPP